MLRWSRGLSDERWIWLGPTEGMDQGGDSVCPIAGEMIGSMATDIVD